MFWKKFYFHGRQCVFIDSPIEWRGVVRDYTKEGGSAFLLKSAKRSAHNAVDNFPIFGLHEYHTGETLADWAGNRMTLRV
jgi:hypothetical protein